MAGEGGAVINRLYVHNFRCLENFELSLKGLGSALLIGKNGSGKTTVSHALEIFQQIGRGQVRLGELFDKNSDFTLGRTGLPMRFELEVEIGDALYGYVLVLELPEGFREIRICEESLTVAGKTAYSRSGGQTSLLGGGRDESSFIIDWHLVALPLIQKRSDKDPLHIFQSWLARMMVLSPVPDEMTGYSNGATLYPQRKLANFAEWLTGILARYPAAYSVIDEYIRKVMPDFCGFENELIAQERRKLTVQFELEGKGTFAVDFGRLSDGEKCFFLCAALLAANRYYEPFFCFWDEPDNYLSISEVGHLVTALRRSFKQGGQLLVSSHNPQAIERFSDDNTFVVDRKSHLEPTLIRLLEDVPKTGDLMTSLICGDITL